MDAGRGFDRIMPVPSGLFSRTFTGSANPDPVVTYITGVASTSDLTTYTYAGTSVGTPAFDRLIVVGASTGGNGANRNVASISIDGVPMNLHSAPTGDWHAVGIASLWVPANATANIDVTYNAACTRSQIMVWTITNWGSTTPIDIQGVQSGGGTSTLNRTFTGVNKAVGIFVASKGNAATCTWTNATERYDIAAETSRASGADTKRAAAGSFIVTTTWSSSSEGCGLCGALWL